MTPPRFSIIIPHRDDSVGLSCTLAALTRLDATPSFEVIVVDNRSACGVDGVKVVTARFNQLDITFVEAPIVGAGPARNAGARAARGDLIAFLDCDCLPEPDWLSVAERLLATPGAVVGGPVEVSVGSLPADKINPAQLFDLLYGFDVARSFRLDGLLLSGNLLTSRETFFRVGDFRTGLSEDRDWCIRARSMGYLPTFSSDLAVMHVALDDVKRLRARWARVARETHAFHRFHGAGRSGGLLYCLTVAASPLVHGWRLFGAKAASAPASIRWRTLLLLIRIRSQRAAIAASLLVRDLLNAVRDALSGASKAGP
ncbi:MULTISPECIES: glycosyltransferase family 2 protein [Novosphingobium]|uniref:Family 2 glycosyl transferase n=1 Tax=Novosphingobium subterraneum TaxID=48936 RepID=A0A0B8ZFR4_9SPHN|nr:MULTISPECIES: glycosyltransferase [Novosphingobium]KHS45115.1 family 2 glycosyl transferase [Novosphingobium subterraneum]QOV96181.1 glycosyltransferase [Novosphingobium sp. ES2-1]